MKLLLTSSGISNPSISSVLVDLLGKPVAEASALLVPTAIYPFPGGAEGAFRAISGTAKSPLGELGWKSVGVLELTALPSIDRAVWTAAVRGADALLVWGGDPVYLSYWMKHSGLADLFPSLPDMVLRGGERRGHSDGHRVRRDLSGSAQLQRGKAVVRRHRVRGPRGGRHHDPGHGQGSGAR